MVLMAPSVDVGRPRLGGSAAGPSPLHDPFAGFPGVHDDGCSLKRTSEARTTADRLPIR